MMWLWIALGGALGASLRHGLTLMVGLLGSFTTFSAYSQQLFELIQGDRWGLAFSYGAGSVLVCLTVFCLSIWGVRALSAH